MIGRRRLLSGATSQVLLALIAGFAAGIALGRTGSPALAALPGWLAPIGTLWVNALRMTVLPLVLSALVLGVHALSEPRELGRLGVRTVLVFGALLIGAASMGVLAGGPLLQVSVPPPAAAAAVRSQAAPSAGGTSLAGSAGATAVAGFGAWLSDLVPANPAKAAADGALLPLIFCTLAFGWAMTRVEPVSRDALLRLVRAVNEASLTLVRWVLIAAPAGVFALSLALGARLGIAAPRAILGYIAVVSALSVALTALLYLAVRLAGTPLGRFARAAAPAQAVAFSTRSSLAALPAMLEGADEILGLPVAVRSFVIPIAAASLKGAGALGIPVGVLFLARLHGVELALPQLVMITVLGAVTSIGAPGIPGGSILVMVPVLAATGIPVDAVGMLLAVDTIPDLFRTTANVTADLAAATLVARINGPGQGR
jgi:Na+/H+-dicarboxylate symporter